MPSWHVSTMINVWTKHGEPRLYGNEETVNNYKNWTTVIKPWQWGQGQAMHAWHVSSMINVWTKYCKPCLYGNGETDLTMKTWNQS